MAWERFGAADGGDAAQRYEEYLVPAFVVPRAEALLARAHLRPTDHILDVACGTGVICRLLTRRVAPVSGPVGVDLNSSMVRTASALRPELSWCQAVAEALPFGEQTFEAVVCQFGLMFFPQRGAAFAEMRRVVQPRGQALLSVWRSAGESSGIAALAAALERHVGPGAVALPQYQLGDPEDLRRLLEKAGFCRVEIEPVSLQVRVPSATEFVRRCWRCSPRWRRNAAPH